MSELKSKSTKVTLNNVEYGLNFTINAIDEIQDHFDIAIENLGEVLQDARKVFSTVRYIISVLINENIDVQNDAGAKLPHISEKYVGRYLTVDNIPTFSNAILNAFVNGKPESDEESPNLTTEQ